MPATNKVHDGHPEGLGRRIHGRWGNIKISSSDRKQIFEIFSKLHKE